MRIYGQGLSLDDSSQHSLDLGRASSPLAASPNVYSYGHVKTMHYLALHQPYQEGLAGGCGDDAALESRHFELPGPNFPQLSTNNSNMRHAPHTVGTYHEAASMDMSFGPDDGEDSCARYQEALLTCASSSSSPSISRPFGFQGDGAHAWWHHSQYL